MKIIISPAKELSLEFPSQQAGSFRPLTYEIMEYLKGLKDGDVQELLKVSDKQLGQVLDYIKGFGQGDSYPAIYMYHGLVFRQLELADLSKAALDYLADHVVILSAMYGPIGGTELIQPYRLDFNMGLKLQGRSLKSLWRPIYNDYFQPGEEILNLASEEFAGLLDRDAYKMVDVSFYEGGKQHASYSKKGRGLLLNYMIQGQITEIQAISEFQDHGYQLNRSQSKTDHFVFDK